MRASLAAVLDRIALERERQETLKAEGRFRYTCADPEMDPFEKLAALGEEFGEVCCEALCAAGLATDSDGSGLMKELVQVAAVATAWAELLQVQEWAAVRNA